MKLDFAIVAQFATFSIVLNYFVDATKFKFRLSILTRKNNVPKHFPIFQVRTKIREAPESGQLVKMGLNFCKVRFWKSGSDEKPVTCFNRRRPICICIIMCPRKCSPPFIIQPIYIQTQSQCLNELCRFSVGKIFLKLLSPLVSKIDRKYFFLEIISFICGYNYKIFFL